MRFGNFVVVKHNGKIVCGKVGDQGIYLKQIGDANPISFREVEPLFEIEVSRPFPEYFKVNDFRKFVISTLADANPVKEPHPAIIHCEDCGCDWLDNGLNPVGCPYCKQSDNAKILVAERDALEAENDRLRKVLKEADHAMRFAYTSCATFPQEPQHVQNAAWRQIVNAVTKARAVLAKENSND